MFPEPDTAPHEMTMACTRPGHYWLTCPVCGRVVYLETDPFLKLVVTDGDADALHRGGHGVQIDGVEAEQ